MIVGAMCATVNEERTCSTDTFPAIMVETYRTAALTTSFDSNRVTSFTDKLLIEDIKHFKERSILLNSRYVICFEMAFSLGILLTPYL